MTHDDLVERASSWLCNTKRYPIVACQLKTGNAETPDVIGWSGGWVSILIEAKISVSDFRADQKKPFRASGQGMGSLRYYIVPDDMREKVESLMPPKWGLLLCTNRRKVIVAKASEYFESDKDAEIIFLSSVIRRIALKPLKGINVRCYTVQSPKEPRGELSVVQESVYASH